MHIRRLAGLVVLVLASRVAVAQNPNSRSPNDTSKASVEKAERVRISNMRTWVDSAANAAPPLRMNGDSNPRSSRADSLTANKGVTVKHIEGGIDSVKYIVGETRVIMRNGERAPATASPLPTIALAGLIAILIGTVLTWENSEARKNA